MTRPHGSGAPPRRANGEHASGEHASGEHANGEHANGETAELQLAQTLIALHRAERAPRAVVKQVEARLAGSGAPWCRSAVWARRLEALVRQIAGIPVAGAVAVALVLLIRWQHLRVEEARREAELASLQAEQRSHSLESTEVTVTGTAVPGSLQWRMYGDDIGMGQCEGKFLLELTGGLRPAPVRVRWTRCDLLPDVLADELRRLSPVHRAPPFTLRGHWTQLDEFEALGLRLRP